jgi:FtsP/CotA-like multicopper oxidase with cupredoxin domain
MKSRTAITEIGLSLIITLVISVLAVQAQFPGLGQLPLDPKSIPKFVDPLPHFAYPGARVDAMSAGTPLTVEMVTHDQQALSTGTVLPNGTVVSPTTGLTHVWAYRISNGVVTRGPLWPTHTIEAKRGIPLNVLYLNNIGESYDAVNLAVDQTLHWAIGTYGTSPYTGDVPAVAHLHGGEVPSWSDGGPDAWYTPLGADGGHGALTNVYYYPNEQEGATLWFHDHALGVTRLNVYAGLAGFYFLREDAEDMLQLSGWSGDNMVQEVDPVTGANHGAAYLPEIEVVIQDRMFDQDGQLYFPAGAVGGAPNPDVHPFWTPEFVGDIITVNGKTWPYLSVAPRKYRLRFLNGSNARFYELWLQDLPTKVMGPIIWQIGTDGGLLDVPVALDPNLGQKLILGPGERADLVIDFGSVADPNPALPYAVWTLKNSGNTPYPKGAPPNGSTLGQIMQFIVNGTGTDNSQLPASLRAVPLDKLADFATGLPAPGVIVDKRRQLTLNEVMGPGGPLEVLVNNTKWSGMGPMGVMPQRGDVYNDFTPDPSGLSSNLLSEIMTEGQTEVWQIINLTADAHPIHLHLVQFQLLSRQKFNMNKYSKLYNNAFVAAGFPLGFEGGWGPPLNYNTGQDPSGKIWTVFMGGNPDVTPYLQGPAMPANPNEQGWKDTFIMYPGQVTTVIARWAPTDANQTMTYHFPDFDPSGGPGYVWHCHIIDHEDNEMMRPYSVIANGPSRMVDPIYAGYNLVHPDAGAFAARIGGGSGRSDVAAKTSDLPEGFSLDQNYPNPFNPVTELSFNLPVASNVKLEIFNILGQKVAILIDDDMEAGRHSVTWDGSSSASGVYFYRLQADQFVDKKKMVLMK